MSLGVKLRVSGAHACFTRPEMKAERVSYDVMTPSAARGILEAIHWKPAILWVVDAIHVLKPIRFHTLRRNEVGSKIPVAKVKTAINRGSLDGLHLRVEDDRQQRATTLLVDVEYVIEAHFEMTSRAGDEDNPGKHLDIFNRRARRGQCFHQPCLGTREFPARFDLIEADTEVRSPIDDSRDLGFMLWDIDHGGDRASMFFRARMERGVVRVPPPGSLEIRR
ncbi:type I-C CRISPR-associated protein Cas5c [Magnetospirillum molischianum]|uniref:pre-crRNA processing endonuclease n=1 Tax=Magnetospirillum molischianum DSM 120 TaxID=1150626 RepID=H8FND7_MAGML|nr:type I-C CRISPR-associated protein Cas5c [Magnetospirillum molischianum]CCG39875.1 CRISPR-associated protein, Csd5d family [Magnetospirillum molischianum DSM 120]